MATGVGIIYLILQVATYVLTEKLQFKGFESGVYGTPPSINYWFRQTAVYVCALTSMKLLVVALFAALPVIFDFGEWLLSFLGSSDAAQVILWVPPRNVLSHHSLTHVDLDSTMGLFPIMMNVLQFWLIDSIVKGSSNYAPLTLVSETPRGSMDPDSEPLFHASDDEDDDDGQSARHDIENPRPRSISRSRSRDERRLSAGEPKSVSSGTITAVPSGSTTPVPKPIDTGVTVHAYPPAGAAASPSSASSHVSSSSLSRSRRRSPPPPLSLQARKASYPNIEISRSAPPVEEQHHDDDEKWASWGEDDEEDWAERVGEEDWTGRRIEARKEAVSDVWRAHSPNPHAIPVS